MKKIICLCLIMATFTVGVFSKEMKDISATEVTKLMGTGWNLGNTLDAVAGRGLGSETSWGQPKTTKQMIDNLSASGMKTIRIPVSWSNHIIDNAGTIDPAWMARVKEIVDWSIEEGLYVVIKNDRSHSISEICPSARISSYSPVLTSTNKFTVPYTEPSILASGPIIISQAL